MNSETRSSMKCAVGELIALLSYSFMVAFVLFIVFFVKSVNDNINYMISGPVSASYYIPSKNGYDVIVKASDIYLNMLRVEIKISDKNHIFPRRIIEIDGKGLILGVKWRGSGVLAVQIGLGPDGKISAPVRQVGPVQIEYHFIKWGGSVPALDIPPLMKTCPPPYPSPYWHCQEKGRGWVGIGNGWHVE